MANQVHGSPYKICKIECQKVTSTETFRSHVVSTHFNDAVYKQVQYDIQHKERQNSSSYATLFVIHTHVNSTVWKNRYYTKNDHSQQSSNSQDHIKDDNDQVFYNTILHK